MNPRESLTVSVIVREPDPDKTGEVADIDEPLTLPEVLHPVMLMEYVLTLAPYLPVMLLMWARTCEKPETYAPLPPGSIAVALTAQLGLVDELFGTVSVIVLLWEPTLLPPLVYVVVVIVQVIDVLLGMADAQLKDGENVADAPEVRLEEIVPE